MHRAELVVSLGKHHAAGRAAFAEDLENRPRLAGRGELQSHQQHQAEAEEQEAERRHPVLNPDPLVIGGEDVFADEGLVMLFTMRAVFFFTKSNRFAQQLLRVTGVEPLLAYSELSFW